MVYQACLKIQMVCFSLLHAWTIGIFLFYGIFCVLTSTYTIQRLSENHYRALGATVHDIVTYFHLDYNVISKRETGIHVASDILHPVAKIVNIFLIEILSSFSRIYLYNVLQLDKGPIQSFSGCRIESFYVKVRHVS